MKKTRASIRISKLNLRNLNLHQILNQAMTFKSILKREVSDRLLSDFKNIFTA
jgi:hypothetical protein